MTIDLTQPFGDGMPYAQVLPKPEFETLRDVEADGLNIQRYCVSTHVGTHLDAPRHFVPGGATIDEIPLDRLRGAGAVVDVRKDRPEAVTVADVEGADVEVRNGDILLLYTGWCHRYGEPDYEPHPWLSEALATWLVEREIELVGVDLTTVDIPDSHREAGWDAYPVHHELLGNDVLVAEHLGHLDAVANERITVEVLPVKIQGGDGAPARVVAWTD